MSGKLFLPTNCVIATKINVSKESDFFIDGRYTFEVGGRHKGKQQINGLSDAYIVADDIEYGINNKYHYGYSAFYISALFGRK